MKKVFLLATALAAIVSCTSDDFVGENNNSPNPNPAPDAGEKAIVFNSGAKTITRAQHTGADAASMLNNNFVFAGTKSDGTTAPTSYVFDQYNANWVQNTANTTQSNSNDWEYVGYTPAETNTKVDAGETVVQSIKYWDYSTTQYDFAAYSLGNGVDPDDDPATDNSTFATATAIDAGTKSYTLTGSADELKACYISDLVTAYNRDNVNDYGKVVTFSFRSLAAKIRLAFYETIPGYAVKDIQFYEAVDNNNTNSSTTPMLLNATDDAVLPTGAGEMTITFPTVGWDNSPNDGDATDYNKAHVEFDKASDDDLSSFISFDALDHFTTTGEGLLDPDDDHYIGRTSNEATYAGGKVDADGNADDAGTGKYYTILPNEDPENLMIRIKFTLVSTDGSEEEIDVDNATAVIPKELAKWSPNYAYTYIFKISDMTNGSTGVDGNDNVVCGLTPITLNAVVVDSEDGVQETITSVSEPSITTYMKGKVVTDNDEYIVNGTHPIYIVVNNGTSNEILYTADDDKGNADPADDEYANAKLYEVYFDDSGAHANTEAINKITEETVDNALRYGVVAGDTYTVTDANGWALVVSDLTDDLTGKVTAIPAEDSPTGSAITVNCASFVPVAGTTYVFQFIKNANVDEPASYTPIADGTTLTEGNTYYTSERGAGKFVATGSEVADASEDIYYWECDDAGIPGEYQYKIIKVAP